MTNVPSIAFTPTGPVAPSEAAVLAGVQQDYDDAFGGGLDPSLSTPQGQLATSTSAIIGNVNDAFVNMANQFNPDFATGRWQDALAAIYFLQRNPSQPTVVQAQCGGGQGVAIPSGSLAQAADGNIYTCTDGGIIDNTGLITLTFACNVVGPIPCPAGTLVKIARAIPGWDSIQNPGDGVLGNLTETRSEFAERRTESVAKNARGTIQAVQGAVLSVAGVLDAFSIQNDTASAATISGVSVPKNSIYVSAVGGADADVAKAIWTKKSPGCGYGGNTTVSVVDDSSGYSPPLPSYPVTFERPTSLPIFFAVVLANSLQVPSDVVAQVQAAIIAAFAGSDGGARARIGSTIYASRYYPPIAALGAWANIISVLVSSANTPAAAFTGVIAGSTLTASAVTSGAVAIGQTIIGATDSFGSTTTILSVSGTAWTVSTNFNVSSRPMLGIVANQTLASVHADQAPTVNANNILVTLT
jgi:uncharacterized phage protein gp47/JayE